MTHKITRRLAALLSLLLITAMLSAGCLYIEKDDGKGSPDSSGATGKDSVEKDDGKDVIGKVTYIGTDYYVISVYTSAETITDYTAIDYTKLVSRNSSRYIYFKDGTEYFKIEDNQLATVMSSKVRVGSLIARITTEGGKEQIILLKESFDSNATADTIGEVVYAGTYITVTLYTASEDVTDYTQLDVSTLTNSGIQGFVYTYSYTNYYIVENGELKAYEREKIGKGDIVVENTDAEGNHNVIVLKKVS